MDSKKDKTVSVVGKGKKPGPLEGLSQRERLERYATLFAFTTEDEIDTQRLAEQWNVDRLGIASMIRYAKSNAGLYADLRNSYKDEDFPEWWYSPAREASASKSKDPQAGARINVDAQAVKEEDEELRAPDPTVDSPIGRGSQRPLLPLQSSALLSSAPPSTALLPSASAFSDAEIILLASRDVYRSSDSGAWYHREEFPDGSLKITPKDPRQELARIQVEEQGAAVFENVRENMFTQLNVSTQSIIKKVALNPSVFWLYSYVTSVLDPDEQIPLFIGDLGDFVSFCVRFAGEAYYGVVPTFVTNRPSFLETLRNQRRANKSKNNNNFTFNQLNPKRDYQ